MRTLLVSFAASMRDNREKEFDVKKLCVAAAFAALAFTPGMASADAVTPFGNTTGTGPWDVSSTSTTYSGLDVAISTPITFSALATLSASFTDISGGADGGSPRIVLTATNGDFFTVFVGTPPNFNDSNPAAFTTAFSGVNLNNGTNNSAYENSGAYVTLASLESNPLYSGDLINEVDFIVDGGWAANGTQDLTLTNLDVNGNIYDTSVSATPLPAALPLFATALSGLGLLGWRRKRKALAA
jgi:hypothetical protein